MQYLQQKVHLNSNFGNSFLTMDISFESMFTGATSLKRVLCGESWVNSKTSKASMFEESPGSISRVNDHSPQSVTPRARSMHHIGTLDEYGILFAVRTISRCLFTGDVFWKPTVCLLNKPPAPTHFSCLYSQWRLLQKYVCLDGIVGTIYHLGEGTHMHF